MKILVLICLTILLVAPSAFAATCSNCNTLLTHCCIDYGLFGRCTRRGYVGEVCGGAFNCDECAPLNFCVQRERTIGNTFRLGTGVCQGVN